MQLRAPRLAPVPPSTRHACVVAPHDLTGLRMLDHLYTVRGRVEGLAARGADEPRRSGVPAEILAAERQLVGHGDRVVDVGEAVDTRKA